jgi:hypothetical protein
MVMNGVDRFPKKWNIKDVEGAGIVRENVHEEVKSVGGGVEGRLKKQI